MAEDGEKPEKEDIERDTLGLVGIERLDDVGEKLTESMTKDGEKVEDENTEKEKVELPEIEFVDSVGEEPRSEDTERDTLGLPVIERLVSVNDEGLLVVKDKETEGEDTEKDTLGLPEIERLCKDGMDDSWTAPRLVDDVADETGMEELDAEEIADEVRVLLEVDNRDATYKRTWWKEPQASVGSPLHGELHSSIGAGTVGPMKGLPQWPGTSIRTSC